VELTPLDYINRGFDAIKDKLCAFIYDEIQKQNNDNWWDDYIYSKLAGKGPKGNPGNIPEKGTLDDLKQKLDILSYFKIIKKNRMDVFNNCISYDQSAYIDELIDTRHKTAHRTNKNSITGDKAIRALDTMALLMQPIDPQTAEEVRQLMGKTQYKSTEDSIKKYNIRINMIETGPFTFEQIKLKIMDKEITREYYICQNDSPGSNYVLIASIPELRKTFEQADQQKAPASGARVRKTGGAAVKPGPAQPAPEGLEWFKGVTVTGYTGKKKSLVIPDKIDSLPVTGIGDNAFDHCENLKSISLPDGLRSIGKNAFWHCTNLESISLPDSLTSIGDFAFWDCENLKSISLPAGLISIGKLAFSGCTNLESISLPDSLTSIGEAAFADCTNLESISLPDSLISIGKLAFSGCTNLESVLLPESLQFIDLLAFYECTNLKSISLPAGLVLVLYQAFSGCKNLTAISMSRSTRCDPESFPPAAKIYYIDEKATGAKKPAASKNTAQKTSVATKTTSGKQPVPDGLEWSFTRESVIITGYTGREKTLVIPDKIDSLQVTGIGKAAFRERPLIQITLPEGLQFISDDAFFSCRNLKSISLPDGLTSIGKYAFWGCTNLESVLLPASLESIGEFAFCNIQNLKSISLPAGLDFVPDNVFSGCKNLTTISMSRSTRCGPEWFPPAAKIHYID
jgi:hypothetical protein